MRPAQRQAYGKRRALPLFALHRDAAVVQRHQLPDQRQTDAGALLRAGTGWVRLVKAVENVRQAVRRNADTGVADGDAVSLRHFLHFHPNLSALRGKFAGIGQQVREDFFDFVGVEVVRNDWNFPTTLKVPGTFVVQHQLDIFLLGQGGEAHDDALQEGDEIARPRAEFHFAGFQAREIEQLVDEPQNAAGVAVHQAIFFFVAFRAGRGDSVLERPENQRQRRAEFVGNIGKKARFHAVELLQSVRLLFDLGLLLHDLSGAIGHDALQFPGFLLEVAHPAFNDQRNQSPGQRHIEQVGPPAPVPRRQNREGESPLVAETAVHIARADAKKILPGRQTGVVLF